MFAVNSSMQLLQDETAENNSKGLMNFIFFQVIAMYIYILLQEPVSMIFGKVKKHFTKRATR